jgi:diketogulonate reductase-like aldo/keto reductase
MACYGSEFQTTPAALALAWVAKNPNTSTVILGATCPQQITENLKALDVLPRLTEEIMEKIEKILDNKPSPAVSTLLQIKPSFAKAHSFDAQNNHGRPALDRLGRL